MKEHFKVDTKIGSFECVVEDDILLEIKLKAKRNLPSAKGKFQKEVASQIKDYAAGKRKDFCLPLEIRGSEFCLRVLHELWALDYGEQISYRDLALRAGRPKAIRAVASIMARNRLPLILPCHRIVASDGTLGGYGGGLKMKRDLLSLEQRKKA